jgi:hypothetical protein
MNKSDILLVLMAVNLVVVAYLAPLPCLSLAALLFLLGKEASR